MGTRALPYFERVIQLEPTDELAWWNYAGMLWQAKRYEEAIAAYDQVLALNPVNTSAWNFKAWIFLDLHCYEEAIRACDGAMAADPNDSSYRDAWLYKAEALRALGRLAEAETVLQQKPKAK